MSAIEFVREALQSDPRLRLASGVALLGAVVALVLGFTGGDWQLAVFGCLFVVGFMILLAIFISITNGEEPRPRLAAFLIWAISLAFVGSIGLVISSYFFCMPKGFGSGCAVKRSYVRGEIENVPALSRKEIGVLLDGDAMGIFDQKTKSFHFVVLENRFDRETMTVTVRNPDKSVDAYEDIKVHLSCVSPFFHSGRMINWRYAEDDQAQPDGAVIRTPALYNGTLKIGEFGRVGAVPCQDGPARSRQAAPWQGVIPGFAAVAQTMPAAPAPDVQSAIDNLTDANAIVRRSARTALANGSVPAVPAILQAMRERPANYQVQLGGSVAMTEMLRQNKADADRIATIINERDDRELLLKAAGHPDRTLRIYASEFLYDLGDPLVSKQALALAARTDNENARYSWLLIAQGGWHKFSAEQKQAASADLSAARAASGPVTLKLFEKLN